ncbi:MAG: Nonspecific acid phosphatase [Hyphomicrobiales bacterium]|nr:Nonspecific acid phosphatase [Hyphomicrobiales bacterium]
MKLPSFSLLRAVAAVLFVWAAPCLAQDHLPSWNDTAPKKAIVSFVERVTSPGSPDFTPPAERIATFDNDGTLWAEQPLYVQLVFAVERVKALAPQHPEWTTKEPFASLLKGNVQGGRGRAGNRRNRHGHARRHDHCRI